MLKGPLKYIAIVYGICIAILFLLSHTQPQQDAQPSIQPNPKGNLVPQKRTTGHGLQSTPLRPQDSTLPDFYQTIIDNNLFRPLGWQPPRPIEPYRLIGTIIPTDGITGAQAILQTTRGKTTYIVTRGDTLGAGTTVIDIQAKQVTLEKAGQQRTLKLDPTPWLK